MTHDASSYDELPYSDHAFPETHPDRLATVGRLYGIQAAPVTDCSVLELGCGLGGNLLPMAATLPGSRFVGIDLSPRQIDAARERASRLGLANIDLRCEDLADVGAGNGRFDYILCHGVYSWVPPEVQEHILRICRENLADGGLATVSYNALPGWHQVRSVRDAILHGAREGETALEKVRRGLQRLRFIAENNFVPDSPYDEVLRSAVETLAGQDPGYVFHEYLEECNDALYFEEFHRRTEAAGLRYVADAEMNDPSNRLTPAAREALTAVADDLVQCEQLLDFLRRRMFRRDVLCHADLPGRRWADPGAVGDMLLLGLARPVAADGEPTDGPSDRFRNHQGHTLTADAPQLAEALRLLHGARPAPMGFAEMLDGVRTRTGDADADYLSQAMLACGMTGFVELHTHLPPIAAEPPQRPEATPVARWQAAEGKLVVDLRHRNAQLDDLGRAVLTMLDGTADRTAIAASLREQIRAGRLTFGENDGAATRASEADREAEQITGEVLTALAAMWLLRKE